jgi:hypothetical protein
VLREQENVDGNMGAESQQPAEYIIIQEKSKVKQLPRINSNNPVEVVS